jgi:hypothetical protein
MAFLRGLILAQAIIYAAIALAAVLSMTVFS